MEASPAELRRSAAIRVAVAVFVAAGLTTIAIVALWTPLDVRTDVVGYPVFRDFNINNYFTAYYLVIGFFPLAAVLLFLGLTRLAPRIGLAVPGPQGSLRPATPGVEEGSPLVGEPPLEEASEAKRLLACAGRVAFVGGVLGLEAGVAANSIWRGLVIGSLAYGFTAVLAADFLVRRWQPGWSVEEGLAAVNAVGAVLSIAGLVAVSMNTEVTIASDGSVDQYRWLPVWLGLPAAAALAAVVVRSLRRMPSERRTGEIERRALLLISAPAALLVLLQAVVGDLGLLEGFHHGEQLGSARLVSEGWFPWKDVVLTHGIFQDLVYTYGRGVFGNSVWGFVSGIGMIMLPLYFLSNYFLLVYLLGRNWLFLLFATLILLEPLLATNHFRLILWPLTLLVLANNLDRPSHAKSVGLAFLVVFGVIVSPEAAPAIPAVALVLVGYEWYGRAPGAPLVSSFPRTLWVGLAGVGFAFVFAIYLLANGALDDFIYVSANLAPGHALSGGLPHGPDPGTVSDRLYYFVALSPVAALLISFAYAVARLRLRRGFSNADWVMAAAAIFVLFYYAKFLSRMDTGHLYQPYQAAMPLSFYIIYRVVNPLEAAIRKYWPRHLILRLTAHPVSLGLVVLAAALSWGTLRDRVENAPARHHVAVTAPPEVERVGYTPYFDTVAYRDLETIIDSYLDSGDRLFDFSNTPLLFHYLIDRDPSTRHFHVAVAYPEELQKDLIDRLGRDPPKLIVFDNDSTSIIGLSNWDGIPNMVRLYDVGQWILDRYRPLLWTHGFTIYARRDQPSVSKLDLNLAEPPVTGDIAFTVQPCTWGYAPNFLSGSGLPPADAPSVDAQVRPTPTAPYGGLAIELPRGSRWSDYRWLEIDGGEDGFMPDTFTLYDRQTRPSAEREISFQTLDNSPRNYVVPVGSCAEWHGYRGRRLFLNYQTPQDVTAVRLIR